MSASARFGVGVLMSVVASAAPAQTSLPSHDSVPALLDHSSGATGAAKENRRRSGGAGTVGRPLSIECGDVDRRNARERASICQPTGQSRFEMFAETPDRFFANVGGIEVTFARGQQGRGSALTIRQAGTAFVLIRVE